MPSTGAKRNPFLPYLPASYYHATIKYSLHLTSAPPMSLFSPLSLLFSRLLIRPNSAALSFFLFEYLSTSCLPLPPIPSVHPPIHPSFHPSIHPSFHPPHRVTRTSEHRRHKEGREPKDRSKKGREEKKKILPAVTQPLGRLSPFPSQNPLKPTPRTHQPLLHR